MCKFFRTFIRKLDMKHLATISYQPQTNRQAERCCKTHCRPPEKLYCGTPAQLRHVWATHYIRLQYTGTPKYKKITIRPRTEWITTWSFSPDCKYACVRRRFRRYVAAGDACKNMITSCGLEIQNRCALAQIPGEIQTRL